RAPPPEALRRGRRGRRRGGAGGPVQAPLRARARRRRRRAREREAEAGRVRRPAPRRRVRRRGRGRDQLRRLRRDDGAADRGPRPRPRHGRRLLGIRRADVRPRRRAHAAGDPARRHGPRARGRGQRRDAEGGPPVRGRGAPGRRRPPASMTAKPERFSFARRVLVAALVVLAVFGVAALVWMSARVLLLAFGGVLLGVLLDGLASALARRTPLSRRAALPVVVVGLVGLPVGPGFLVGPQLSAQMGELGGTLSGGLDALRAQMERSPLLHPLLDALGTAQENSAEIARRMAGVFATMMGGLGGLAVIVFIGVYLAADPGLYQRGVLHLVRKRDRARGQEVLSKVGHAIRSWVLGQFISMCFVGVMVTAGLLVIGVPIPLALGLIAFLLEFIPYVGPLAAFVPIVLVAPAVSPQLAVYAIVLYGVIQFVESYL